MCGLAGVLLYPTERPEADWQAIRTLFTRMLVANEERGREATGVALIQQYGTFQLFKQPMPATEFVRLDRYREILAQVEPASTCLLGHARLPTKGSPWHNANNHPLLVGHTLGIHNGVIHNDDELFASLRLFRQAEVDSEILFRLLNAVPPFSRDERYLAQICQQLAPVDGVFASLSVDLRRPTDLVVLKHNCPLCLHYEPALQALFFSSRYLFLRQAFGHSVRTEALAPERAYLFSAVLLPQHGQRPVCSVSLILH